MAWQKAGTKTLTSSADSIVLDPVTSLKFTQLLVHFIPNTVIDSPDLRFNNDTANNYARRQSSNGGSDSTVINQDGIIASSNGAFTTLIVIEVINITAEEKLVILHLTSSNTAGAGNLPIRTEVVGKWINTSEAINRIDYVESLGAGNFNTDTNLSALGTD